MFLFNNEEGVCMKKYWLFFVVGMLAIGGSLFFFWKPTTRYAYELSVCAIFKNEAPWLKEWIVYHNAVLGVDHFYLYNNDSTDNYKEVLAPFIEKGIVELIDWSSSDATHRLGNDELWYPYQIGAYNDCLKNRALGQAKWVAVIDVDEFVVPVQGVASFRSFLRGLDKKRIGNVKMTWRNFGTSDVWDLNPGELLVEKLVKRGADEHPWNQCFKAMHRPEAVALCHIHDAPKLQNKFRRYHVSPDELRVQHYWSRTAKCCAEKRGLKKPENREVLENLEKVEDRTMDQYIPLLKSRMI
jgi:hypothetical protein